MEKELVIAGIDPGHTTGLAVVGGDEGTVEIYRTQSIPAENFTLDFIEVLRSWRDMVDVVVVERYPVMYPDPLTLEIFRMSLELLHGWLPESVTIVVISPGDWKPVAKLLKWKKLGNNKHENEAINIARYWQRKVGGQK